MNPLTLMDQLKKIYDILPNPQMETKQLLLEPISTVIKIGLLQWYPEGTKLSVVNNSVCFNEPTLFQGVTRTWGGDSRQDLHNLCYPLVKCLEWYPRDNPRFQLFYEQSQLGLEVLRSSYEKNSLINHTIDHYIGLLQGKQRESIEDTPVTEKLKEFWSEQELQILETMIHLTLDTQTHEMYFDLLQTMIYKKEQQVHEYIQTITTSY
mgnify:FL=1